MVITRRVLVACLGILVSLSFLEGQQLNRIQQENRQPGTTAWQLTDPADKRQIEGYASLTSVPVGGNISLFVNTADETYSLSVYRMGWYGGKGGRRVLGPQTLTGVKQITPTPDPTTGLLECQWTNPFTIHVPTSWLSGIYLVKLHGNTSGKESYITFAVRDSRQADLVFQQSVITYHAYNPWPGSDPFGQGYSLYNMDANNEPLYPKVSFNRPYGGYDPSGVDPMFYSSQFARYGIGAGDFLNSVAPPAMEFAMLRWLEHEGYNVTYITDVDTHEDVGRLRRGKGFLSVGHDEYWSEEMRAHAIQARDAGVSLGFFGGNYLYWNVELLPDTSGIPNRTISLVDPTKHCTLACMGEPEQSLVGGNWVPSVPTNGDIVVLPDLPTPPLDHWVFANTDLKFGDIIPGLIGTEYNATHPAYAVPVGLRTLLHTQAPRFDEGLITDPEHGGANGGGFPLPEDFHEDFNSWYEAAMAVAAVGALPKDCQKTPIPPQGIVPPAGFCSNPWPVFLNPVYGYMRQDWAMTIYQADSGAFVFNAATNQWSWGLDDYFTGLKTADGATNGPAFRIQCGYPWFHPGLVSCRHPAVEQMTRNVLNKFIGPK
jgi:N,N-dimethylformamidase beta subunit-like, C-terminal